MADLTVHNQSMKPIMPTAPMGTAWVEGWNCTYAEDIRSEDLVEADFESTKVHTGGGLYLVEEWRDGEPVWRGCRRMTMLPGGVSVDHEGNGKWVTLDLASVGWRVVATVVRVYKPTRYQ